MLDIYVLCIANHKRFCNVDTTDVQSVNVLKGEEYVLVQCRFAEGSMSKGCHVEIQVINAYTSARIQIERYNIPRIAHGEDGSFCLDLEHQAAVGFINVYDWEENGTIGSLPIPPTFEKESGTHCT